MENGTIYYSETLQKWVAQYTDLDGKRKTITQRKNEKVSDFKKRFANIMNEINNGTYISSNNISLYEILDSYIENNYKTGIIADRTYLRNKETLKLLKTCCKNFINKPIQKVILNDIKISLPNFIENETTTKKTNEKVIKIYSQNTIDKLYTMLKRGFKIAFSERIILFNLMDNENLKKPKAKKELPKVEALSVEEQKKLVLILENSNYKYRDIILLALFTGMRIGEVLAITNNNIDLKDNTIKVERTLTRDKNDKVILGNTTKTKKGKRTIYLSNNAISVLKRITLSNTVTNIYNLIFYDYEKNTFITPTEINCFLKRLNEKYKFWYFKIKECKESGLSVKDFCDKNNIKPSTYYNYQQKIRNILCDQINENSYKNEVSFFSVEKQPHNNEKIIIIKGSIKIELDSDTLYQSIEPLLKSLL